MIFQYWRMTWCVFIFFPLHVSVWRAVVVVGNNGCVCCCSKGVCLWAIMKRWKKGKESTHDWCGQKQKPALVWSKKLDLIRCTEPSSIFLRVCVCVLDALLQLRLLFPYHYYITPLTDWSETAFMTTSFIEQKSTKWIGYKCSTKWTTTQCSFNFRQQAKRQRNNNWIKSIQHNQLRRQRKYLLCIIWEWSCGCIHW